MTTHQARVIDVLMPPIPWFHNISFLARVLHMILGFTAVPALVCPSPSPIPDSIFLISSERTKRLGPPTDPDSHGGSQIMNQG